MFLENIIVISSGDTVLIWRWIWHHQVQHVPGTTLQSTN